MKPTYQPPEKSTGCSNCVYMYSVKKNNRLEHYFGCASSRTQAAYVYAEYGMFSRLSEVGTEYFYEAPL